MQKNIYQKLNEKVEWLGEQKIKHLPSYLRKTSNMRNVK
jgi:hypothetical protein